MEYFDLVDENDNVIGVTNKKESHENSGIHRVVAVYVFDSDNKLYIQKHLKSGGLFDHSIGGHVHQGETYDDAAKREANEELGLREPLMKISTFYSDERFSGLNLRHFFTLYECHPSPSWKFHPNDEVKELVPLSIPEIVAMMNKEPKKFTGGFLNSMQKYLKQTKNPNS